VTRSSLPTLPDLLPPAGDERVQSALARLTLAFGPRGGHVVVTAPTARAAEALVWRVETSIVAYRTYWVSGRALDAVDLLRVFATDVPTAESLAATVHILLGRARSVGRPVVIVVSDADAAAVHQLDQLRLLADSTPEASDLLRLVLLGAPGLLEILRQPAARALASRVTNLIAAPAEPATEEAVSTALPLTAHLMSEPRPRRARRPRPWRIAAAGVLGSALAAVVVPLLMPERAPSLPTTTAEPAVLADTEPPPPPLETHQPAPPDAVTPAPVPLPAATAEPVPTTMPPPRAIIHPPSPATPRLHSVQVGAFRELARATALRDELARSFEWVMVTDVELAGTLWHRVRVEGLADRAAVEAALARLRRAGHQPILVRP
jgi:cell division septation protein DedD